MQTRRAAGLAAAAVLIVLSGSSRAADPQTYSVELSGVPAGGADAALRGSSQLITLQKAGGIPPFALVTRAREDIARLQTALDSFGYYQNHVTVTVAGLGLDDPELPARLDALPAGTPAPVKVTVAPGPLFHVGRVRLDGTIPDKDRAALNLHTGDVAVAATVLGARERLLAALQEDSFALASVSQPDVVADDNAHTLDITYTVTSGPRVEVGTITFKGLKDVHEELLRKALTLHEGAPYRPSSIEAARQALVALGIFSGISVRNGEQLSPDGRMPLVFDVQERPFHAVTFAGNYSTDLGISLSVTWSDRNLFGSAEQLNLTASGTGLGSASTGLGYNLTSQYIQPLFLENDQTLEFDISGVKQQLAAYDQTAQTLAGFVRRKFSRLWTGSAGLSITHDQIVQERASEFYELLAAPVTASYDSTGITDALSDPVSGLRAAATVTATHAFGHDVSFLVTQISGSSYFDLSSDGSSVIALRALAATILGASNLALPPDQRLYAGGSATVRGYAYQSLGPQFSDRRPMGAKSVDAGTVEFRQRIDETWGAAAFVDAGQASTGAPFDAKLYAGAGLGARYYTPIGAVRLDVATPLVRVPGGDAFEIYIGLGQAF